MKTLALAVAAAIVIWTPASAGATPAPHTHISSFHHSIDWD